MSGRHALLAGALMALLAGPAARAVAAPAAVACDADIATRPAAPVLLIHGTGVDARVNWSWGYAPALRRHGHGVCTIDLPDHANGDVQRTIGLTRAAVLETFRRGGRRKIALLGHSQGAYQAAAVLRMYPGLAPMVDDVVGLSGVYVRGSDAVRAKCMSSGCAPALWQLSTGSHYLAAVLRRPLPAGPSYTAIGTVYDSVVTPQPAANALPPGAGRSIEIQDICPGRRVVPGYDHIYMAGDAVAYAVAMDALTHAGPADPARIAPTVCAEEVMPDADPVQLALVAPDLAAAATAQAPTVDKEPPLRCPLAPRCVRHSALRARLLRAAARTGARVGVRIATPDRARLRLRLAAPGRPAVVTRGVVTAAGRRVVSLPLVVCPRGAPCRGAPTGRWRATVQLRAAGRRRFRAVSAPVPLRILPGVRPRWAGRP